jgi:Regulator of chromosome condensation (RCC1) repeat
MGGTTSSGEAGMGGATPSAGGDAAGGEGGAPEVPETVCTMPGDDQSACRNCGSVVTLPGGQAVCDCPSGTWGARCELLSQQVAVNSWQTCVLRTDGSVMCSGGDSSPPPAGVKFKSISGGGHQICGVDEAGSLRCWGQLDFAAGGPRTYPAPPGKFADLDINGSACALDVDGLAQCWAPFPEEEVPNTPSEKLTQVVAGWGSACGLRVDRSVLCWGDPQHPPSVLKGEYQRLALGSQMLCGITLEGAVVCSPDQAFEPPPAGKFVSLALSATHGCALQDDGKVSCWKGPDDRGAALPPPDHFQSIDVTESRSCGVRLDGSVTCWGSPLDLPATSPPTGVYTSVASRNASFCGIKVDGTLDCWGADGVPPPVADTFLQVAPGANHACGVRSDGSLRCWGNDVHGETTPPAGKFQLVSSGFEFSCALTRAGTVSCWGSNDFGQLATPAGTFVDLALGYTHACAVRSTGAIACWGAPDPNEGDVGGELITPPAGSFAHVFAAGDMSCGQRADGTVTCWGIASTLTHGEDKVPPAEKLERLALGSAHTCGLTPLGDIECWGYNVNAESDPKPGPFLSINAGAGYTCGLHPDGRLECWGVISRPWQ